MTTKQILIKARALIKKGWAQALFAVNIYGASTSPRSKDAAAWCALGALRAAATRGSKIFGARRALANRIPGGYRGVADWNDEEGRTKRQVLALFDRAIKSYSKKGR